MTKLLNKGQIIKWLRENDLTDPDEISNAFSSEFQNIIQVILDEELTYDLGYSPYDVANKKTNNSRNGHSKKTVKSDFGEIKLLIPRDKKGEFEPCIVKKHERTIGSNIEEMIISLYARGMSTRDITNQLSQVYGLDASADMITTITDKILPIAKTWQNRQLDPLYPFLYLDGIVFPVKQDSQSRNKTVYIVYAITLDGKKDILGIWIGASESAKFWMNVLSDLRNRGVQDILITSVDGLNGFEEAIKSIFPRCDIQLCIVHQIRNSTRFVSYKDRKAFCGDMREIYTAPNEEAGLIALDTFEKNWGEKYPYAIKSWRSHWSCLATFFKYPPEIRKMMYTTNPIESFNRQIRKVTKNKGMFPTDDALFKVIYLVVASAVEKWTRPVPNWGIILNQLCIYYDDRITPYLGGMHSKCAS